jgi:hypothetical protein
MCSYESLSHKGKVLAKTQLFPLRGHSSELESASHSGFGAFD